MATRRHHNTGSQTGLVLWEEEMLTSALYCPSDLLISLERGFSDGECYKGDSCLLAEQRWQVTGAEDRRDRYIERS